jgi:hypothetical protein
MIKICSRCRSTWAGGTICEDCGGGLTDPFATDAQQFPEEVWRYIRLQYGARRGMIVRVSALLLGPVVGFLLLRRALALAWPWSIAGAVGALVTGFLTWALLHRAAGYAVRVWVLRRGRLRKGRYARAMARRALRRSTASRRSATSA